MWPFTKKKVPMPENFEVVEKERHNQFQQAFEAWRKEVHACRQYTTFKPIEDPLLVKDALPALRQLKIDRILECQRQLEDSRKKYGG